ncbi:hypothetical protein T484DRAFT_1830928, partial [Baffinella frigidus]
LTAKTAPGVVFTSRADLAEHNRSDWHRLNLKRLAAGEEALEAESFNEIVEGDAGDLSSISGSDDSRASSDAEASDDEEGGGRYDDEEDLQAVLAAQADMLLRTFEWHDDEEELQAVLAAQADMLRSHDVEEELQAVLAAQADMRLRERAAGAEEEEVEERVREGSLIRIAVEGQEGQEDAAVYRALLERVNLGRLTPVDSAGVMLLAMKSATVTYFLVGGGHFLAAAVLVQGSGFGST